MTEAVSQALVRSVDVERLVFDVTPPSGSAQPIRFEFAVDGHASLRDHLACVLGWEEARRSPPTYELPAKARKEARDRYEALTSVSPAGGRHARVLWANGVVRASATQAYDVLLDIARRGIRGCELVYYPPRLRNTRNLCARLFDMLRCAPDALVVGMGFEDHVIAPGYGQPDVDLDEFEHRVDWAIDVAMNDFGVSVVFALNPPKGQSRSPKDDSIYDEAVAAPYCDAAVRACRRHGAVACDLRSYDPSATGTFRGRLERWRVQRALAAAVAKAVSHHRVSGPDTAARLPPPEAPYGFATRGVLVSRDGSEAPMDSAHAPMFFLAACESDEAAGADEGSAPHRKPREQLGGRNYFERHRQKQIIDWLHTHHRVGRKRVMIIGDSIRMRICDATGYGLHAYRRLLEKANLFHVPHNCGGSRVVLEWLDNWLACRPQIVHLNAGLHDLSIPLSGPAPYSKQPAEDYAQTLDQIVTRLRAAGVETILWGLSTPVQEQWHRVVPGTDRLRRATRLNADVERYNRVSMEVMSRHGVPVTDMHTPLWEAGVENVLVSDGVHLNHRGSAILGEVVANAIEPYL